MGEIFEYSPTLSCKSESLHGYKSCTHGPNLLKVQATVSMAKQVMTIADIFWSTPSLEADTVSDYTADLTGVIVMMERPFSGWVGRALPFSNPWV